MGVLLLISIVQILVASDSVDRTCHILRAFPKKASKAAGLILYPPNFRAGDQASMNKIINPVYVGLQQSCCFGNSIKTALLLL